MKIVKLLIVAAFISLVLAAEGETERNERKLKGQSKTNAGWKNDYDCDLRKGADSTFGKGKFTYKTLQTPGTGPEKYGWCFEMYEGPTDILKRSMVNASGKNWCVPYRFINASSGTYVNPIGRKWISFHITNDSNESWELRVYLPYALIGWVINDDESNQVKNWVANHARSIRATVSSEKTYAVTTGNTLVDNKASLAAASGDQASFQKSLTQRQADINTQTDGLKTQQSTAEQTNTEIKALTDALSAKKATSSNISAQMNIIRSQIDSLKATLEASKGKTAASQTAALQTAYDADIGNVNAAAAALKALTPTQGTVIDGIKGTAQTSTDKTAIVKPLANIVSSN